MSSHLLLLFLFLCCQCLAPKDFSSATDLSPIPYFPFYQIQCIWPYVKVHDLLELSFLQGDEYMSFFILLQNRLLKMIFFSSVLL